MVIQTMEHHRGWQDDKARLDVGPRFAVTQVSASSKVNSYGNASSLIIEFLVDFDAVTSLLRELMMS